VVSIDAIDYIILQDKYASGTCYLLKIKVAAGKSPQESGVSAICQASIHCDKENDDPIESSDWLHRNDEYVRKQRPPLMPLQTEGSNSTIINTGMLISNN
jgi:hypothetical protein